MASHLDGFNFGKRNLLEQNRGFRGGKESLQCNFPICYIFSCLPLIAVDAAGSNTEIDS